jgi:hypothetical protein
MADDSEDWIRAWDAVQLLKPATGEYGAQKTICERAYAGLIRSRAVHCVSTTRRVQRSKVVASQAKYDDYELPAGLWWPGGHNISRQNWDAGDFKLKDERDVDYKLTVFSSCARTL